MVCARAAGGHAYQVQATYASGQELIAATHSFAYRPWASYVVIFWSQAEASVIELDYPNLSVADAPGHDQAGRRWMVSTNPYCL